ncbi:RINT1-like protein [Rhypophila decipiens]|uniref:RINT1-like protein n=1 Tax=Rhypophila decipiens TaxID=261697 RepID=A0AAN7BA92_9PEZI|nr:RINT1-like protein [Rhypophila decipiens]
MEPDIRVEDYLDDKLQSATDFEHLDTLISSVEFQRSQLQSQLDDASKQLEAARQLAGGQQTALNGKIDEFERLQHSIDVRLQIVAASDAPDEAIRRLELPMKQLHKVDLAWRYLLLLQDVQTLCTAARSHLPQSPKAALEPYTTLKQLSLRLRTLQGAADEAAAHLVAYVEAVTKRLWDDMKQTMWKELEAVLKKRGWPDIDPESEVDGEWLQCFEKLMDLQAPEVLYSTDIVTLLPIDVMVQIFVKEFRFHFMSDKPTSSPQSIVSHCFPWFLQRVEKWEAFFRVNFGPILAAKFSNTEVSDKMIYMDPVCALITALLPVMREKIAATMTVATKDPAFLSSLMGQLMVFDENIRFIYNYDGGDVENGWSGLTSEVLDAHFDTWLQAEKKFALDRYHAIMAAPDARNIDYDFAGSGKTKPTYAATRVVDLLKSVTAQYERVRRISHKKKFLIDIQVTILDEYHNHLRGILEAYVSITSTVGRAFVGATKEQLAALEGTGTLETLCKVYGSADHIANALKEWNNEEFFVTLWDQLQGRPKSRAEHHNNNNLAGVMSDALDQDRTSSSNGTDEDDGALFDETIAAYSMRKKRAQEFLSEALIETHRKTFRPYTLVRRWATISDEGPADGYEGVITPELDEPLRICKRDLEFLSKALGTAALRRVWRDALDKLSNLLWSDVLMSHKFAAAGAQQFANDVHAISALVDGYVPGVSSSLGTLGEALTLLNLPLPLDQHSGSAADQQEGEPNNIKTENMDLKIATDRVFLDNSQAKMVLDELSIHALTPANARQILQRRVENAE